MTLGLLLVTLFGLVGDRGDALVAALAFGIAVASVVSWRLTRPLDNLWQRGVVSVLSVFGALFVAFILTIPARQVMGLGGLVLLAVVLCAAGFMAARWSRRGRGPADPAS